MRLNEYKTLGRSGLRVSPLCLGAMTFGTEWKIGVDRSASEEIFNGYIEAGGNFVDTADAYNGGESEVLVGKFVAERCLRDWVVLATKFSVCGEQGNPNAGGNGRKNIYRAVESSLRRFKTDYIDLYCLHVWDVVTPVEEVVSTLTDLIRDGKIRYYSFSDTPAWYIARAHTLAELQGKERPIALQLEYSLVERNIEREHIPAAQQFGIGICPWGPLANGFLSGKYKRNGAGWQGDGRLQKLQISVNPTPAAPPDRHWQVLDTLVAIAKQVGKTPAQVALNWVATQPGITSPLVGATTLAQLTDNLKAIEFALPAELRKQLDDASAPSPVHPYTFFEPGTQAMLTGGTSISPWTPAQLYDRTVIAFPSFLRKAANSAEK